MTQDLNGGVVHWEETRPLVLEQTPVSVSKLRKPLTLQSARGVDKT